VQADAGAHLIGEIVDVEIRAAGAGSLSGVIRGSS
jgi:hypothetical protein